MSTRAEWVEAGARALLGKDEPCKRWGIKCVTHTTNYLSANFSNQSEAECDRVRQARGQASIALAAVEPLIRATIAADIESHLLDDQAALTYWDGMLDGLHAAARIARAKEPAAMLDTRSQPVSP